jgi:hypothetical protein
MTDHQNSSAGSARLSAIASRIAEIEPSWLPIAGHVRNVTLTLDEADLVILALTRPATDAQPAIGCGDPSCKDPNCDYGKNEDCSCVGAVIGQHDRSCRFASQPSPAATVEARDAVDVLGETHDHCDAPRPQCSADSVRAFAEDYASHKEGCEEETWHGKGPIRCSCGYYEALDRITDQPQAVVKS